MQGVFIRININKYQYYDYFSDEFIYVKLRSQINRTKLKDYIAIYCN